MHICYVMLFAWHFLRLISCVCSSLHTYRALKRNGNPQIPKSEKFEFYYLGKYLDINHSWNDALDYTKTFNKRRMLKNWVATKLLQNRFKKNLKDKVIFSDSGYKVFFTIFDLRHAFHDDFQEGFSWKLVTFE